MHHISDDFSQVYGIISKLILKGKKYKQSLEFGYHKKVVARENQILVSINYQDTSIDSLENQIILNSNRFQSSLNSSFDISEHLRLKTNFSFELIAINFDKSILSKWMLIPEISLRIRNTPIGSFGLNFQRDFSEPLPDYFLLNYQLTGYQSFKKGGSVIAIPRNNQLGFTYQIGNRLKTKQFTLMTKLKNNEGDYAQNIQIDESIILNKYEFIKGGNTFSTTLEYTSYFKEMNISTNFGVIVNWSNLPFKLNTNDFLDLESFSKGIIFSGTTYFTSPINLDFDFGINWVNSNYNGVASYSNWVDLSSNLLFKIKEEISGAMTNKYIRMPESKYFNLGFDLNYTPEDSKFSYQLIGENITGQRYFKTLNIDEYSTTNTEFKLIPRYLLASVKYRF